MGALTTALGRLAPGLARAYWRARIEADALERAYAAAQSSGFHRLRPRSGSGDAVMQRAGARLRDAARDIDENNDRGVAVLDALVNRVVGTGIRVQPAVRRRDGTLHAPVNDAIRRLRARWGKTPEVTRELPLGECERLTARTWLRDGEVLIQHVTGRSAPYPWRADQVPYAVELIEADHLPFDLTDTRRGIRHGVEKNDWGTPTAYHLLRRHPGDQFLAGRIGDTKRVPAEQLTHLKFTRRIRQTRGVSIFHAVIRRFDDLLEYEESERIAARVAAAMCAVITRADGFSAPTAATLDGTAATGQRSFEMSPGMVFDNLQPGEGVELIKSDRPNTALAEFVLGQLRAVAGGTGTSASTIARNYQGSYASQRQELVESAPQYQRLSDLFICKVSAELHARLVEVALLSGALAVPLREIDPDTLTDALYQAPGLDWVDPKREAEAAKIRHELGLTSRAQLIRERGGDPDQVFAELAGEGWTPPGDSQETAPAGDDTDDADDAARDAA